MVTEGSAEEPVPQRDGPRPPAVRPARVGSCSRCGCALEARPGGKPRARSRDIRRRDGEGGHKHKKPWTVRPDDTPDDGPPRGWEW